jgi:hypothetical protein
VARFDQRQKIEQLLEPFGLLFRTGRLLLGGPSGWHCKGNGLFADRGIGRFLTAVRLHQPLDALVADFALQLPGRTADLLFAARLVADCLPQQGR